MSERSGDRDRCLGDVDDRYLELLTQALAAGLTEAGHDDGVEMLCLGGRQVEHARGADVAVVPTLRRTHSPARRADHDFGAGPGRPPGLRADDGGRGIAVGDEQPHRARPSDATASGATRLPASLTAARASIAGVRATALARAASENPASVRALAAWCR